MAANVLYVKDSEKSLNIRSNLTRSLRRNTFRFLALAGSFFLRLCSDFAYADSQPQWFAHSPAEVIQLVESARELQGHLQRAPDDLAARLDLAHQLRLLRSYEACQDLLENVLREYPDNARAKYELAILISAIESTNIRSLNLAHECVRVEPQNEEFLYLLGNLQQRFGFRHDALRTFEELYNSFPDNEEYLYQLAVTHHFIGDDNKATQCLSRYLERCPGSSLGHALAGRIALGRGETEIAIDHFERAITSDPQNDLAYFELGKLYLDKNEAEKSMRCFQKAVEGNPFAAGTMIKYAEALGRANRRDEAKKILKNVDYLRSFSEEKRFFIQHLMSHGAVAEKEHALLASELLNMEFYDLAEPHLEAVIALNSRDYGAVYALASLAFKKRNFPRALELFQKVHDTDITATDRYQAMLAISLHRCGKQVQAVRLLEEGLERFPNSSDFRDAEKLIRGNGVQEP